MDRRRFLTAGAAIGAGMLIPSWSWAGAQSVAGFGGTTPPWTVWDDEADAVIAAVIERGEVPAVNAVLRTWTKNGQALPAGLRADLRDFIEEARRLPSWASTTRLRSAVDFNKKRGTYLGVAYGFVSGMMSTVIPHEARAVYYSRGGADMKRRISRTAKFGYEAASPMPPTSRTCGRRSPRPGPPMSAPPSPRSRHFAASWADTSSADPAGDPR